MRTINANLTTEQKKLSARRYHSLVIGPPGGTTYDASAYLVGYRYEEQAELPGRHEYILDNAAGTFNTLTGALAPITAGAIVTFQRGVTIAATDYGAELPRVWIEALEYTYRDSRATLVLHCIDGWEKLRRTRVAANVTFTVENAGNVLEYIVEAAGLTLEDHVLNGDFETYSAPDWTYWTRRVSDGAIADEGSVVHGGSHAVKLTAGASLDTWVYTDITVEATRPLTLRVWARGDGTYSGRYALYDSSNTAWITALTTLGVTAAAYAQVDIVFTVPAGCTGIRLYLACPATDTGFCYVDDVEVLAGLEDMTVNFEILTSEHLLNAAHRLLRLVPQYTYFALDGAVKTKELDPSEASIYTLGWNAQHQLLQVQRSVGRAWEVNRVTINGEGAYTGTASDATQIAAVGTRQLTVHDIRLDTDAECLAAATATLRYFQARAQEVILIAHPVHGLELYDMLTLDTPPWGGSNVSGRVIGYIETWNRKKADWQQVITLGYPRHYINQSGKDGSEIVNIPAAGIVLDSLQALTTWTGDLMVDGELEITTDGYLRSGQTGYDTGTGFWLEYNAGTPRFSLGVAAGSRLTWNGTTLTIVGTVTATAGELQTLSVTGTLTLSGSGKLITAASPAARIELDTSYLAGYSDATTKQFYIDAASGLAYAGGGKLKLTATGLYIRTPSSYMDAQSIRFVTDDANEYDLVNSKVQYTASTITEQHLLGADSNEQPSGSYMQTHLFGTGVTQWYVYLAAISPSTGHSWLTVTNTPATNLSQLKFYGAASVEVDFEGTMSVESLRVGTYDPATRPTDNDVVIDGGLVVGAVAGTEDPAAGTLVITDGVTAPAASISGMAILYIDTADGDLKCRFADGFVATIAADS